MNKYDIPVRWILDYIHGNESDVVYVNDSQDTEQFNLGKPGQTEAALDHATASDEAVITVKDRFSLYLVYGNDTHEVICDAGYREAFEGNLNTLCHAFAQQFDPEYHDEIPTDSREPQPEDRPDSGIDHQP